MFKHLTQISSTWPALLASAVFVCWPSLVRGSCCCETKQTVRAEIVEQPSSCCQSKSTCDKQESDTEFMSSCNTLDVASTEQHGHSDDCRCCVRCCRGLTAIASTQRHDADQQGLHCAILVEAKIEFPSGIQVQSSDPPDDPLHFLLAQDRCAQICRWLK
jgi:hypothetical protein